MNPDNYKDKHLVICTDPTGTETIAFKTHSLSEASRMKVLLSDRYPDCDYDVIAAAE